VASCSLRLVKNESAPTTVHRLDCEQESCEGNLDLAAGARPNDIDLHPDCERRRRHIFRHAFDIQVGRIDH
jgi:hypothetical protein